MKIVLCLLLLTNFLSVNCFSQVTGTYIFHVNKLPPEGVLLDKGWKFTNGDDPAYASAEYDDSRWQGIDPTLDVHDSLPQLRQGIGWFRLHLSIDSNLLKNPLALEIQQAGASEIYLNGKLVQSFGVLSIHPDKIRAYNPCLTGALIKPEPVLLLIDKNSVQQVLAVKYALQPHVIYTAIKGIGNYALQIQINTLKASTAQYQNTLIGFTSGTVFSIGFFVVLFILHLAFYLFYPPQKANLFFCLYAIFVVISSIIELNHSHEVAKEFYILNLVFLFGNLCQFFLLTAVYYLLQQKRTWLYWTLLVLTIIGIVLNAGAYSWGFAVGTVIITNILNIEIVRVAFIAAKRKHRGARIIVAGGISYLVFFAAFLFAIGSPFHNTNEHITPQIIIWGVFFILASSSLPVATSIYLGLDFAFTNRTLTKKLIEVNELSQQAIAQEQEKQQILATQKETLEHQVQERTAELKHSLEELKSTQAQLIQSEKMASLGQLTAGIAHEIQNPLNFVNNFSEINKELIEELRAEKENPQVQEEIINDIKQNLDKIIHHGKRADSIVKGMLQHSRTSSGKKELTDINALIDECVRLSYHGIRAKDKNFNAMLNTDFDDSIGKINIIPQDISRVLLNLLNNAFYAVNEKKAKLNGIFEPAISVSTKKLDGKVEIQVKDNGNGIPQNIVDKIFQPFFTTKPTGQGTGLGLSLSYDIVKAHGGEIKAGASPEGGSVLTIILPGTTQ